MGEDIVGNVPFARFNRFEGFDLASKQEWLRQEPADNGRENGLRDIVPSLTESERTPRAVWSASAVEAGSEEVADGLADTLTRRQSSAVITDKLALPRPPAVPAEGGVFAMQIDHLRSAMENRAADEAVNRVLYAHEAATQVALDGLSAPGSDTSPPRRATPPVQRVGGAASTSSVSTSSVSTPTGSSTLSATTATTGSNGFSTSATGEDPDR